MTRIGQLAPYLDGIPVVQSTTERDTLFPSPDTNQRVWDLGTGYLERWNGSAWIQSVPLGNTGSVVTARSFGAKGDGSTDDTSAINNAIAVAQALGWVIRLEAGAYAVTAPLAVTSKCSLIGDGPDRVSIVPTSGFVGTAVLTMNFASTTTAVELGGFTIDCSNKTTLNPVEVTNLDTSRLRDLRLLKGAIGLKMTACGSTNVDHVVMRDQTTNGILLTGNNNGELGFRDVDIACDTGTMVAGFEYDRTNGTDVGGIYLDYVRVIQAGAGVITNGFKFTSSVTCGVFLFASRCVADGISGGHSWSFSNITEIRMQGCWGTNSAAGGSNLSGILLNNAVNVQIHDGYYGSASRDISVTGTASRLLIHQNLLTGAAINLWEDGIGVKTEMLATGNVLVGATPYSGAYWLTAALAQPQFLTPVAFASDISATGGYRQQSGGWKQDTTVAASQTDVVLTDTIATRGRVIARQGSITGVAVNLSSARTAGTLTVKVQRSTDGGATWATVVGPSVAISTNVKSGQATFGKDQYGFAAGDMLRLTVTTDGSFTPTANNLDACLEIET